MKSELTAALTNVLAALDYPVTPIVIQLPKNPEHGDFSSNLAMQLSGKLKSNPQEIAKSIAEKLENDYPQLVKSAEIAGPGFINIRIQKEQIVSQIKTVLDLGSKFGKTELGKGKKALVEFVSANPTGPLTVGHGRGAILGDVVSNILHWNGYEVKREYYYNDAGLQMERLGKSVKARYLELVGQSAEFPDEGYEGEYIIDIARDLMKNRGDNLQDSDDLTIFTKAAEKSIFQDIRNSLEKIGLTFDRYFNEQSLYESGAIEMVLDTLKGKDLIYENEGASWFRASAVGREQDRVVIKSSGEPTYRLPDIAYHRDKFERGYDLMVDVLGTDHMDAYPDVLAGVEQLGYHPDKITVLIHQFVTLTKDGKPMKMSTRKAQYVTLDELIDEVGVDVVRYFFLMRGMNTHLNFDMDLARDESDENPVYYLQYAHARLCNILKHAESMGNELSGNADVTFLKLESEIQLIKNLMEFPTIVERAHGSLEPQSIANYLHDLAGQFHRYYAKERVVSDDKGKTAARLVLVRALQIVLCNGLNILGIQAPERM
jgi:arginyl-tRNA synthetase